MERLYLISYDISKDALRSRVAKKLIYYGCERLQYSVYAGSLRPAVYEEMQHWLRSHIKGKDSVLIIPLPPQTVENALSLGESTVPWDWICHKVHTLYIG
jgi:CRISPR-associated endonuclease Cas2